MTKHVVTPVGTAKWIDVVTPKVFGGAAPTPEAPGRYQVSLMLDPERDEVAQFLAEFREKANAAFEDKIEAGEIPPNAKKYEDGFLPVADDTDRDGNVTGMIVVKAGLSAGGKRRDGSAWTRKVVLKDLQGKTLELADGEEPSYGTKLRMSLEPFIYNVQGTSMWRVSGRLRAVQIVDLQTAGGATADDDFAGLDLAPEAF